MKKKTGRVVLTAAAAASLFLLAGCQKTSGGESTGDQSSTGAQESTQGSSQAQETGGNASSDPDVQNPPTAEHPRKVLISVNNNSNPDSYVDADGNYTGYEPEMLKAIDELLPEYEFEYTSIASTDALLALEAGKLDASLQRWEDNEQRRQKYLFSNEYYLTYTQNVTVWGDRDDIQSLDDLDGKTVLVKAAGGSDDYFWQNYIAQSGANIKLVYLNGDNSVLIQMFQDGEVDACTMVKRNADKLNANYGSDFKTVGDTIMASDTYILFNMGEETLRNRVDEALAKLREEGFLSELSEKWYGADYSVDPYK